MNETKENETETNLQKKLSECELKSDEYLNSWKRAAADLINYKKDEAKRLEEFAKFSNENVILGLVALFDEISLALNYTPEELKKYDKWAEGIENLMKKFNELLERHGVKKIATIGEKFDPLLHEAVSQEPSDKKSGTILEEIRPGYNMSGKIIRAARVVIAS
ncbi:MAG: nucleotide exchange factor GrpE [bacterium]|nr:nucleotide exchange factor GrpE [bacterium]